jgi:hypothetical protein
VLPALTVALAAADVFLADGYRACVEDGPAPLACIARVLD